MKNRPSGDEVPRVISSCPLCDARYSVGSARVLADQKGTRLVHATCRKCGSATLALVVEGETGGSTVGLVTDLSHEDVLRFHRGSRVNMDDVIEIHEKFGAPLSKAMQISLPKRRSRAKTRVKSGRAA